MARSAHVRWTWIAVLGGVACRTDLDPSPNDGGAPETTTTGGASTTEGAGAGPTTDATSGSSSAVGGAGGGTSSAGGAGGGTSMSAGGAGGGTTVCVPGEVLACYSGPPITLDVGACHAGEQICDDEGSAFGPCEGEVTPIAETCATADDDDCDGTLPSCPGDGIWQRGFAGLGIAVRGRGVAADGAGNVLATGYFHGAIDFGGGPLQSAGHADVFVVKLDPNGVHLWSKRFGDHELQTPMAIAADGSGNAVVGGYYVGSIDFGGGALPSAGGADIFVAKLDPLGNHLWSSRFGSDGIQNLLDLAIDAAGNVVLAGRFEGTLDFGGGPLTSAGADDAFVVKLDQLGNHVWSKRFGDVSNQRANAVAVDANGGVVVGGDFWETVSFGGSVLDGPGMFVAKLDASGDHVWSYAFERDSGPSLRGLAGVTSDSAGDVVIVGDLFGAGTDIGGGQLVPLGSNDVFVAKLDGASGAHSWSQGFGGSDWDEVRAVATDGASNVIVTGRYSGAATFGGAQLPSPDGANVFLVKLDPSGGHLWSKGSTGAGQQEVWGVAIDPANHVLVTGDFTGTLDFGTGQPPLTSIGDGDVFVAKLAP
jgi:hypothetical protein